MKEYDNLKNNLEFQDFLRWQISKSLVASLIWFDWGQDLYLRFIIWRSKRRYKRYLKEKNN